MDQNAKIVDAPILWPTHCAFCPSQKGPQLDSCVEYPSPGAVGRMYVCRTCAKQISKLFGFAKGEEMERLENAAQTLEDLQKELASRDEMVGELVKQVEDQRKTIVAQESVIEEKEGKISQLKHLTSQFENLGAQIMATTGRNA